MKPSNANLTRLPTLRDLRSVVVVCVTCARSAGRSAGRDAAGEAGQNHEFYAAVPSLN
jgi:hypothetical protein